MVDWFWVGESLPWQARFASLAADCRAYLGYRKEPGLNQAQHNPWTVQTSDQSTSAERHANSPWEYKAVHSADQQDPNQQDHALARAYRRLLDRLEALGDKAREGLHEELDEAVAAEHELESFTKDELALARAYLERDLHAVAEYVEETGRGFRDWLRLDLSLLEARALEAVFSAADPTGVGLTRLRADLSHRKADPAAGEVCYPGEFSCQRCGHVQRLVVVDVLPRCSACSGSAFRRVSA